MSAPLRSAAHAALALARAIDRLRWAIAYDRSDYLNVPLRVHPFAPPDAANRVTHALDLIAQIDPLTMAHIRRHLPGGLAVEATDYATAWFDREKSACLLGARHLTTASDAELALSIMHEVTHARLEARGIPYDPPLRLRIERICIAREIALAHRLAKAGACAPQIVGALQAKRAALTAEHLSDHVLEGFRRLERLQRVRLLGKRVPHVLRRCLVLRLRRQRQAQGAAPNIGNHGRTRPPHRPAIQAVPRRPLPALDRRPVDDHIPVLDTYRTGWETQ